MDLERIAVAEFAVCVGGDEVARRGAIGYGTLRMVRHTHPVAAMGIGVPDGTLVPMDPLTTLLLDAQRGDRDALERFVALTQHDVRALCRYLGDADNIDDLAQQAYERAIKSLHRYRAEGPAKNWLLTITRRTCADATRQRRRVRRLRFRVSNQPHDGANTDIGSIGELDEFLRALDLDRRVAFVLTQVTGLSYEEAAQVAGVPIGTIRSRVARARAQLTEMIEMAERAELPARQERPGS